MDDDRLEELHGDIVVEGHPGLGNAVGAVA